MKKSMYKMIKSYCWIIGLVSLLYFQSCEVVDPVEPELPCNISDDFVFENDPNRSVDYTIDCETLITGNVRIEPGTVIEFSNSGSLVINDGGHLKAIGTEDMKIIFRGDIDGQGTWRGIHFKSNSLNNVLDFCEITNAGNEAWSGFTDPSAITNHWENSNYKFQNTL